ncbi:MAG: hypothetical protein C0179_07150 [Fervidicoccus sp.]|nr:MAG: hypothetical protein C0179_07150 [Fervidicoccus sp.]
MGTGIIMSLNYCPYTHSSPPLCAVNRVERIEGNVVELIKYALETKKRECIYWGYQTDCYGAMCVEILAEDQYSVKLEIDNYGGCWGGVSERISLSVVATIPKSLIE